MRLRVLRDRLRLRLWLVPAFFAVTAALLALVLVEVDRRAARDAQVIIAFGGTPEGARSVLSTIAQSMLTFTGLVFSITMLVLQLASTQLSPRVMRTFLRDRKNQTVLGLFVATFLYTLLVLQAVRADAGEVEAFVPALSIGVAFVLLLASIGAFVFYIDHMAHAVRASSVITSIAKETREALDDLFPEGVGAGAADEEVDGRPDGTPTGIVTAPRPGAVTDLDQDTVWELAQRDGRAVELVRTIGDYVPEDAPLYRVWGRWDDEELERLRRSVSLAEERTVQHDPAFGFRQLVDVALRALSPGVNDPTTAVQAIGRLHDLLHRLATRRIPPAARTDEQGRVRLILPRPGWDDYVRLATDEIRLAGHAHLQVMRRLRAMIEDLAGIAPPPRQPVLRIEMELLERAVERSFEAPVDRAEARRTEEQGSGRGAP